MFGIQVTPQVLPSDIIVNAVQLSSYSLSLVTTVLSTVIIVIRILMVSRMPGASRQPRTAMEIIVESASLYSISALVYTSILSFDTTFTSPSDTYQLYADVFFAHMAVASHPSCLLILNF